MNEYIKIEITGGRFKGMTGLMDVQGHGYRRGYRMVCFREGGSYHFVASRSIKLIEAE